MDASCGDEAGGEDTEGHSYTSIADMWSAELAGDEGRRSWYAKATSHWQAQDASIDGVLGGYPETNGPDLRESRRFLELLGRAEGPPCFGTVLDCGAGIGRVSRGLLAHLFAKVDLVEPNERLLGAVRDGAPCPRLDRLIACPLQQFRPEAGRYDVIWAQWVLLYLPDDDLVQFLERCRDTLRGDGMICCKDNVVLDGAWVIDREDNSIVRTDEQYKAIFRRAGLEVLHEMKQTCWPPQLLPVKMYALRPVAAQRASAAVLRKKPSLTQRRLPRLLPAKTHALRPAAACRAPPARPQKKPSLVRRRPAAVLTARPAAVLTPRR